MVFLMSLWLPILASALAVFFLSWLLHMVFKYHNSDFKKLPSEDAAMDSLRGLNIPPGDYMMPHGGSSQAMKDPAFIEKFTKGPVAIMTFMPPGKWNMGQSLFQWFILCVINSVLAAYITWHAVGSGAQYLEVFRFAGCTGFVAFTMGQWQDSIWYKRSWGTTMKNTFDGLLYGLFMGGVFGSLWPSG